MGVSTPQNLTQDIKNLFCPRLLITAELDEDTLALVFKSSKFVSKQVAQAVMNTLVNNSKLENGSSSLLTFLVNHGYGNVEYVKNGFYYDVIAYDNTYIKPIVSGTAKDPSDDSGDVTESVDELMDTDLTNLLKDSGVVGVPSEFYMVRVGTDKVLLKWKYDRETVNGMQKFTRTLIEFYDNKTFVPDLSRTSMFVLPSKVRVVVLLVLDRLGCLPTGNPAMYSKALIGTDTNTKKLLEQRVFEANDFFAIVGPDGDIVNVTDNRDDANRLIDTLKKQEPDVTYEIQNMSRGEVIDN
jgi:hypothetical protein